MNEKLEQSRNIVKEYMWWSTGAGLMPIPVLDVATVTGVQLRMVSKLSEHYNISFSKDKAGAIMASLAGSISASTISKGVLASAVKTIPILGSLTAPFLMPTFSGAVTYALGMVFIQHFESGGTLLDFDPEKTREYFRLQFQEVIKETSSTQK
ncbi:MAG: DUF697 domain-containing protein [Desulfamplus sp.]|nr:DUF697 domain-containing protein [Desulfamplus sp.]